MKGRLPWEISRVHSVSHFFTTMPQMGGGVKWTLHYLLHRFSYCQHSSPSSLLVYVKTLEIVRYQNKGRKPFQNEIANRAIKNKNCQ